MPSIAQLAVTLLNEAAGMLERAAQAMPDDKFTWKVMDTGRTALDQIMEVGAINRVTAQVLQNREFPPFDMEAFNRLRVEYDTREKALDLMKTGTAELVAAVEAFPESDWDQTITLPFLGGMQKTLVELVFLNYWNMSYHNGQVNFIQTLYGDKTMH